MTDEMIERRRTGRLARLWWAVRTPGRLARFNRARKTKREVTRGYLWFRDFILIGFITAIVLSGVYTVRSLRVDDCRGANARRFEVEKVATDLLGNDRNLIEFADSLAQSGLPESFTAPLLRRYAEQQAQIDSAFAPSDCTGADYPDF